MPGTWMGQKREEGESNRRVAGTVAFCKPFHFLVPSWGLFQFSYPTADVKIWTDVYIIVLKGTEGILTAHPKAHVYSHEMKGQAKAWTLFIVA